MDILLSCCFTLIVLVSFGTFNEARVWDFAFSNDGPPANFFKKKRFVGQSVDMVKQICRLAKQKCRTFAVPRKDCWDDSVSPGVSKILDDETYEVCANLVESPDRLAGYRFSEQNIYDIPDPVIITKEGSPITLEDLKTCNDYKMAFPKLTALNRDCLLSAGFFVKEENLLPVVATGSITAAIDEIVAKVKSGEADIGLVITRFLDEDDRDMVLGESPCLDTLIGLNMMVNQDTAVSNEFLGWWTPTLKQFICSGRKYKKFCKKMEKRYGEDPLCFVPGVDVDCTGEGLPPPTVGPPMTDPCQA